MRRVYISVVQILFLEIAAHNGGISYGQMLRTAFRCHTGCNHKGKIAHNAAEFPHLIHGRVFAGALAGDGNGIAAAHANVQIFLQGAAREVGLIFEAHTANDKAVIPCAPFGNGFAKDSVVFRRQMPGNRIQLNEACTVLFGKFKAQGVVVQGVYAIDKVYFFPGKCLQHRFHILVIAKVIFHNHSVCAAANQLPGL